MVHPFCLFSENIPGHNRCVVLNTRFELRILCLFLSGTVLRAFQIFPDFGVCSGDSCRQHIKKIKYVNIKNGSPP
jgi:hypothetical protein